LYHPPLALCFHVFKFINILNSIPYRDYKNANYQEINKFFLSFNWNDTFPLYSANESATFFNDALLQCINSFVPLKVYKTTSSFPCWVSKELKHLIYKKKMTHSLFKTTTLPSDYCKFSELRVKCKLLSKLNYQTTRLMLILLRLSYLNHLVTFGNILNRQTSIPSNIQYGSITASSDLESASLFSQYFASVFKPATSPSSHSPPFEHPYSLPSNCYFSPDDVLSTLD